ncbi:hypothetical protein PPROV_001026700 [Pycnococcus provasolii]|uniref:AB hydrolase-1 domain-containing protein n=1 Tax=Pycnococcus provasolii TaxID=41880 RepID=A0A830I3C8_9CHLO|nr:hypothetical protein PPROV_001026700 [Pycnococcus provasolii]
MGYSNPCPSKTALELMTPAERAKWVAGDDPAANAAPDMGNDVEDAAAAAQAKGNDVLAGENQPPPAKKKKASTLMNFSAIIAVSSSATLACTLTTPASSSSPQATAILIHGWRSSQNASIIQVLKNRLLRSDFAVLTYDARGCGASTGEQTYGGFSDEVKDLKRVVAHVETKLAKDAGVPPIKLLFGHSRGGNVALLYASRVGGIPAVVSAAARAQLNEGIRERLGDDGVAAIARGETLELPAGRNATTRVTPNDVAERLRINMNDELEMVCDTAFLLVAAHDDAVVPSDDAQRLKAMIPPRLSSDVVVVPGACHRFRDCESEVAEHVVAFVCSQFDLRDKIEGRSRDDAAPSVLGEWRKASMSK